jgi:hypothetical protein
MKEKIKFIYHTIQLGCVAFFLGIIYLTFLIQSRVQPNVNFKR